MDKAIVSFANERGNYYASLERLRISAEKNGEADFIGFKGEDTINAPLHVFNPYAFKIYAIDKVIELGYKKILWVDSSAVFIRNAKPIWDEVENKGYIMQEAGHYVGRWCNDETLKYFNLERDEADKIMMYGNSGFLGLNFDSNIAVNFLNQWRESMLAGCFKGSWDDHRHDMTCGSIIANRLGMEYKSGNDWLHYAPPDQEQPNEKVIIHTQGM